MKAKTKKFKLTPPDRKQCQAMIPHGCHPCATMMFILGPGTWDRCTNKPECIVTEREPGAD